MHWHSPGLLGYLPFSLPPAAGLLHSLFQRADPQAYNVSVGIRATLETALALAPDKAVQLATQGLREPYPEIQKSCAHFLVTHAPHALVECFADLADEIKQQLLADKPRLMDAAERALRTAPAETRLGIYRMIDAIGDIEDVLILTRGIADANPEVRRLAGTTLQRITEQFLGRVHRLRQVPGDADNRKYVEEHLTLFVEMLTKMVSSFENHASPLYIQAAMELGEEGYPLVRQILLSGSRSGAYRVFMNSLDRADPASLVLILFRMFAEPDKLLAREAATLLSLRKDPAFGRAVIDYLMSLDEKTFLQLCQRTTQVVWFDAVMKVRDMTVDEARRIFQFILACKEEDENRSAMIARFLHNETDTLRAWAVYVLDELGYPDIDQIALKAIEDPSDKVKLEAARIIQRMKLKPREKLPYFVPLINSANAELRRLAMKEIAQVCFDRFLHAFDSMDDRTRESVARIIARLDENIADRLVDEIYSLDPARRLKALKIIQLTEAESDLQPVLVELLNDPDRRVRATCLKVIQFSGNVRAMRLLIDQLSDPDRRVRANAIEAVEQLSDERFSDLLVPFLKDPDNRVRANAAKALWNLGRKREARETLESMLDDPAELMRLSAVWALGEIRYEGFRELLQRRLAVETSVKVKSRIEEALLESKVSP